VAKTSDVDAARKKILQAAVSTAVSTGLAGLAVVGFLLGYLQPGPAIGGPTVLQASEVTQELEAMRAHCAELIAEAKEAEAVRCHTSMEVVDSQMRNLDRWIQALETMQRRHRRRLYDSLSELQENVCGRRWRRDQRRIEDDNEEDDDDD